MQSISFGKAMEIVTVKTVCGVVLAVLAAPALVGWGLSVIWAGAWVQFQRKEW